MKVFIVIISTYFLVLLALPTLQLVKSSLGCKSTCCKKEHVTLPKKCQKQNCFLNCNFTPNHCLVAKVITIPDRVTFQTSKLNNLKYLDLNGSNFNFSIWHPPKKDIFA